MHPCRSLWHGDFYGQLGCSKRIVDRCLPRAEHAGRCAGFGRPGTLPPRVVPFDADLEEVRFASQHVAHQCLLIKVQQRGQSWCGVSESCAATLRLRKHSGTGMGRSGSPLMACWSSQARSCAQHCCHSGCSRFQCAPSIRPPSASPQTRAHPNITFCALGPRHCVQPAAERLVLPK